MGHATLEVRNPGPLKVAASTQGLFLAFAVIGLAATVAGIFVDSHRGWAALLMSHFFWLCIGLGGLFIAAIQWLTSAMWSAPVRRISESFTAYLPIVVIGFIAVFLGMNQIFKWTDPNFVRGDVMLEHKAAYLNKTFFIVRNLVAVGLWIFFAKKMVGNSVAQDQNGDLAYTNKNKVWSPLFIVFFAITFSLSAFDLIMSLDPHWFSTMFAVYCFAGLFYSSLAMTAVITVLLKRKGLLDGIVNSNHLHDLGKFMFAFTVFWAYIGFSQFMLIWYANLPEETMYYMHRMEGSWKYVSVFLIAGKFLVPFFALLPREAKRSESRLLKVGIFMLLAQFVDIMWMVQPQFFTQGPVLGWMEIGAFLGGLGLFGLMVMRFLSKNAIVAFRDPKIIESVHHHHQ